MLFWKLLVAADLLILAGYSLAVWKRQEHVRGFDYLNIPIGLVGTTGLIMYAFTFSSFSAAFWQFFLPVFVASGAWEISAAVKDKPCEAATIFGASAGIIFVGLTAVALYRLGGSHWIGIAGL